MKHLKMLIIALLFATFTTAQPLPELPVGADAVTGIVIENSAAIQVGDVVFTYYSEAGSNYLTGLIAVTPYELSRSGFLFSSFNSNQEIPNGNPSGAVINLGLERNNMLFRLNASEIILGGQQVANITTASFVIYVVKGVTLGTPMPLLSPVPYITWYASQCPKLKATEINAGAVAVGDEIIINDLIPTLCQSFGFTLQKGTGKVFQDGLYTWRYKVGPGDSETGVQMKINIVPFTGCNEDVTVATVKINFEQPVNDINYPNLTRAQFDNYMRYFFDVTKQGNTVKACYEKKRPGSVDTKLPELKFEVYTKVGGRSAKVSETRVTTSDFPCEFFIVSDQYSYLKVTEIQHGYYKTYE